MPSSKEDFINMYAAVTCKLLLGQIAFAYYECSAGLNLLGVADDWG